MILDSKEPDGSLQEFLSGEVRYASLKKTFPDESKRLRVRIEEEFMSRHEAMKLMAEPTSICKDETLELTERTSPPSS